MIIKECEIKYCSRKTAILKKQKRKQKKLGKRTYFYCMEFSNQQIDTQNLPSIEEVHLEPLEADYLTTQRIAVGLGTLFIIIAAAIFYFFVDKASESPALYISFGGLMLLMMILYIGNLISFRKKGYALREKDVLYRSGWLVQRTRILPLNRVQHVSVQSGPIERRFGLGSVSLYTAGSENADFSIKGLKEEKAQQIKEWITNQLYDQQPNA